MILWILRRNFPHGVAIGEQARALWRVLEVGVQITDGRHVGPFPLRSYAHIPTAFRVLPPGLQLAFLFHSGRERIAPIAEGNSPVRDSAGWILSQNRMESFYGTAELEGMQQRNRPIEFLLSHLVAGGGKVHRSQPLDVPMRVLLSKAVCCQRQ